MSEKQVSRPLSSSAVLAPPAPARPFREIVKMWPDFLHMDEAFFAEEAPHASAANIVLGITIMVVVGALISQLSLIMFKTDVVQAMGPATAAPATADKFMSMSLFMWIYGRIGGFLLFNGLIFALARLLGGRASFLHQLYVQTIYQVPLGIVMTLTTLAPGAGLVVALMLAVYTVTINVKVVRGVHGLSPARAWLASVIPAALILAIVGAGIAIMAAIVAANGIA